MPIVPWPDPARSGEVRKAAILPRSFYMRDTVDVARGLLGKLLVHAERAARIVEVEAYLGREDRAAHAWRGETGRTRVLFGEPGHAYVYLIYGMYECLNLVAEPAGSPGCVLIRALEPVTGIEAMRTARGAVRRVEDLSSGPGKLTRAMGITREHYGRDVTRGSLTVRAWPSSGEEIAVSARIGITHCKDWPLRFFLRENACVSRR
ncbi:MAG: DNA-3-methyladenine glycosylase [Bryobacteraceae bacterium]